jgi:hypothetical protein
VVTTSIVELMDLGQARYDRVTATRLLLADVALALVVVTAVVACWTSSWWAVAALVGGVVGWVRLDRRLVARREECAEMVVTFR